MHFPAVELVASGTGFIFGCCCCCTCRVCEQGWAQGTWALPPHTSPQGWICGAECWRVTSTPLGGCSVVGRWRAGSVASPAGSECSSSGSGGRIAALAPSTALALLGAASSSGCNQTTNAFTGTNNPLPDPGAGSHPAWCWHRCSNAQVGQEFKGSCWGWLGCRAGSCTSPSSLSQPASKPPRPVCPVLLFLEFLAQHPKTIPAPQINLSSHKQPRGGVGLVTCSSSSSQQAMEAPQSQLVQVCPRMGWILHSEQMEAIRSPLSDLQDGQELLTGTHEE